MTTTKLNTIRQTQPLSKTTRAFADREMEALLSEINRNRQPEPCGTRLPSLEGDNGFSRNIALTFLTNRSNSRARPGRMEREIMKMLRLIALLSCLCCLSLCARTMAQVPGAEFPANSPISDQRPGSVLVFPLYSSTANGIAENTRIAITNLGTATAYLRLYLVNGGSGQITSFQDCLAANQTNSFTASDFDPAVRGFIVVVAVGTDGKPVKYNFLAGEEDIKLASGHRGSLKATAIAALIDNPGLPVGPFMSLQFDDIRYNRLPRTVAANKLKSLGDGNQPLLVLVSIAGHYESSTVSSIGTYNGSLMGNSNAPFQASFSLTQNSPQLVQALSASYPPTSPNYSDLIQPGDTGWLKLWRSNDAGLLGAVLNYNAQSGPTANTSGHNLRVLTLATFERIIIPVQLGVC